MLEGSGEAATIQIPKRSGTAQAKRVKAVAAAFAGLRINVRILDDETQHTHTR